MGKIRLDLDALEVESFATDASRTDAKGRVHANDRTQEPAYTCGYTCGSRVIFLCCTG